MYHRYPCLAVIPSHRQPCIIDIPVLQSSRYTDNLYNRYPCLAVIPLHRQPFTIDIPVLQSPRHTDNHVSQIFLSCSHPGHIGNHVSQISLSCSHPVTQATIYQRYPCLAVIPSHRQPCIIDISVLQSSRHTDNHVS
jgi:hypothetical protein